MGRYGTITNQSFTLDVSADFRDNGWSISEGIAIHESCNEGYVKNINIPTTPGTDYKITYTVSGYSSGEVYAIVGGINGESRTANGTYTETITASDASGIQFWSDGDLAVESVSISDGEVEGSTLVFNEKYDTFAGWRSYVPDFATKFLDDVLVFRNGTMWLQNSNETRNNFFGAQYPSIITFYFNINPTHIKTLSSVRIVGNKPWYLTDIEIRPRAGKSKGQVSRLKPGNFRNLQGQWFGDFMRDMLDPRFPDPESALYKGAVLQGEVAKITMEITEASEVRLLSIDILGPDSQYTY